MELSAIQVHRGKADGEAIARIILIAFTVLLVIPTSLSALVEM
jgi:hypothetical protein